MAPHTKCQDLLRLLRSREISLGSHVQEKNLVLVWGGSSADKVFVLQTGGPDLNSQQVYRMLGIVALKSQH